MNATNYSSELQILTTHHGSQWWPGIALLRRAVYIDEQNVPEDLEWDEHDADAVHLAAMLNGQLVATARVVVQDGQAKIGRLAVATDFRKRGIATKMVRKALSVAQEKHITSVTLDAQTRVTSLYEKLGFHVVGEEFIDAGIWHLKMVLDLSSKDRGDTPHHRS